MDLNQSIQNQELYHQIFLLDKNNVFIELL